MASMQRVNANPSRRIRTGTWTRPTWAVWGVAVIAWVGALLFLLPSIAAWFSQTQYSQAVEELSHTVREIQPSERARALEEARSYNRGLLTSTVMISRNERLPQAERTGSDSAYAAVLAADDRGLMARLNIPSIRVDLPIYHGTDDETLKRGVGHLQGSSLPVGGSDTHAVLTAHRGLSQAELFTHLDRVAVGDTFTIEVFGEVLTYRVIETSVVKPQETGALFPRAGRDLVTLITCTPLGINSHRILVTGERVTPTPAHDVAAAGSAPEIPGFPWWLVHFFGVTAVIALYVARSGRSTSAP